MKRTLTVLSIFTLSLAGAAATLALPALAQTATPQATVTGTTAATATTTTTTVPTSAPTGTPAATQTATATEATETPTETPTAGEQPSQTQLRTVTVIGVGRTTATPDIARVILGVDAVQSTLSPAVTEVNSKTADIIAAVKAAGIEAKDIQTAGFSIFPQQNFGPDGPGPITGYRVSNTVRVTIRNLDQVASLLDVAINAGANNVQGLTFTIDNPAPVEAEARVQAVADARAKADALAREAGAAVGRVFSISEVITGSPIPLPSPILASAADARGGGVSIESGSQDVFVQIQVVYELE